MHKHRRPDSERISIKELRKRFEYRDVELFRTRRGRGFSKKTGSVQSLGYHRIKIDGKHYFTHHLVFAIHKGRWPSEVDHIDRNKLNNRIENLREVTRKENQVAALAIKVKRSDGIIYESISAAARLNRLCAHRIREAMHGLRASHGGFGWSEAT